MDKETNRVFHAGFAVVISLAINIDVVVVLGRITQRTVNEHLSRVIGLHG